MALWRHGAAVGVLICGLLCGGLPLSAASAARYHVYTCHAPNGELAPVDGWTGSTSGPGTYVIDGCNGPPTSGLTAAMDGQVAHATNVSDAIWTFTAAPNLTLDGATLFRHEAVPGGVGQGSSYATFFAAPNVSYDAADVFENCQANLGCRVLGSADGASDPTDRLVAPANFIAGAKHLFMDAFCGGLTGQTCPISPGYGAEADLYSADLTLEDAVGPVAANLGGSLLAGGTLSGPTELSFTASDLGSGVYSAQLTLDGQQLVNQVIDGNGGRCQTAGQATDGLRDFRYEVPCRATVTAAIALDTRLLRDGRHALQVSVDDAAGNVTTVFTGTITTQNPSQGGGAPSETGASGGAGAGHAANGTGACAIARLTAGFGSGPVAHVAVGAGATLRGGLSCAGHPVAGATVEVSIARRGERGSPATDEVRTGPDGSFRFAVTPGPSRTLRLSYRAFADDVATAATAEARFDATATIGLSIRPLRVRNGQSITYTGRVFGGSIPASGLPLDVQYRDGRRWRTFDQTRARRSDGRFIFRYTFRRTTIPIIYTFRVRIPAGGVAGYPYGSAWSRPRSVRVDP